MISADDHVVEPPHLWIERLPTRYRDEGPRIIRGRLKNGVFIEGSEDITDGPLTDCWAFEDVRKPITRMQAAAGFHTDELEFEGMTFSDMRPGCYDPVHRLRDMDMAGIERSLCFPNMFIRFCGQTFLEAKDRELGRLCIEAYNDWIIEEWCASSGGRLIPLTIIPMWDPVLSAREIRRNAVRGGRAISFSELPAHLGLPSIHDENHYWDPVFDACEETSTVICIHIGSSSQLPTTSPDAPRIMWNMLSVNNSISSLTDWLFSGIFERFAGLRVCYSEAQIGWIPYVLERSDWLWKKQRNWAFDQAAVKRPPSEYYYEHVSACFVSDQHGLESLLRVGTQNVLFESDYPHSDSNWPNTRELAAEQLAGLDSKTVEDIVRGNAVRIFNLDPSSHLEPVSGA